MQYGPCRFLAFALFLSAATNSNSATLVRDTDSTVSLSQHPVWLRLLHYEPKLVLSGRLRSAVVSPDFFLAPDGASNPDSELAATLDALYLPPGPDPDSHAQCRFPARYLWLKQHFDLRGEPTVACHQYNEFSSGNKIDSVSLVLATGYLNNPASFYGHTLLKFNAEGQSTGLLDESLNYGAIIPGDPNPLAYVVKGIFGGYEGGFTHIRYYFHNHNYGENELRDLWEYELNLTSEESAFVAAHAWEMIGKRYDYYFLRRNCGYRIGKLLEIVPRLEVVPDNYVYTIPQALVQKLQESNLHDQSLVNAVIYHPSRQSRFYMGFAALDAEERKVLTRTVETGTSFQNPDFDGLPIDSKRAVLDVTMDYYQYLAATEQDANPQLAPPYYRALAMRYQLPVGARDTKPLHPDSLNDSPHLGRKPSLVRFGIHNGSEDTGLSLTLRPAYYDALDAGPSHLSFSRLSMAEVALTSIDGTTRLRHIDLINIESVRPSRTGLPGDGGNAWMLRAGAERQQLDCDNCLVSRLQADRGWTRLLGQRVVTALYGGGALQENRHDQGHGFLRLTMTTTAYFGNFNFGGRFELRRHTDGNAGEEMVALGTLRYQLSESQEMRFSYEHNRSSEASLSIGFYW